MKWLLSSIGRIAWWCAWPVFWVYFKRSYGRTRVVLVNPKGEVLVMHQWISSGKWHLPGGGLHRDEDKLDGALRELSEETGVRLIASQLANAGKATCRARGFTYDIYVFTAQVHEITLNRQRIEVSEIRWLPPSTLTVANAERDVFVALELAGVGKQR